MRFALVIIKRFRKIKSLKRYKVSVGVDSFESMTSMIETRVNGFQLQTVFIVSFELEIVLVMDGTIGVS
jgi:hypothetical protein